MGYPRQNPFGRRSAWLAALVLGCLSLIVGTARAQDVDPATGLPVQFQQGEIKLKVEKFGVEDNCRAGEWVGVRVQATDTSTRQREVVISVHGFDPDGDTPLVMRTLTTNPGIPQSVWLYFRLPYNVNANDPFTFTAHEALELPAGDPVAEIFPYTPGRLLGRVAVTPSTLLDASRDMIGVMGTAASAYGLKEYAIPVGAGADYPLFGHELRASVTGITPENLPDRWMGLLQFSVIVWGEGAPENLRGERAEALKQWIIRGGHLVIILPAQAWQKWTNPAANELYNFMPAVSITPREGVSFEPLRPLLTTRRVDEPPDPLPRSAILLELTPQENARPAEAIRVLDGPSLPDGTPGPCLVARRLVGTGMVTLVGIDLNQPATSRAPINVSPDVFWNRILGGRTRSPSQAQRGVGPAVTRSEVYLDQDIGPLIAKTGTAAAGILLGFVVFAIYWIVAGPGGFAILKNFRWTKHSWAAYVGVGGVFTAIAWTGATLIRPMNVSATHLTIVDYVSGNNVMRARAWMSVLIPRYGDATIRLGKEDEPPTLGQDRADNTIAPWEERRTDLGSGIRFPDSRGYAVDARSHSALRVPVRATVKQLEINWAGLPAWQFPMPCRPDGSAPQPSEPDARIELVTPSEQNQRRFLSGAVKHALPAPLEDVLIIVVRRQKPVSGTSSTELPVEASAFRLDSQWPAGEALDLGLITQEKRNAKGEPESSDLRRVLDDAGANFSLTGPTGMQLMPGQVAPRLDSTKRLAMLALYGMLEPPSRPEDNIAVARRASTHNLDLNAWFTEPCLIIIGQMSKVESPVPLTVDGRQAPTDGRTVVRWIYPLGSNPPTVITPSLPVTRGDSQGPG